MSARTDGQPLDPEGVADSRTMSRLPPNRAGTTIEMKAACCRPWRSAGITLPASRNQERSG